MAHKRAVRGLMVDRERLFALIPEIQERIQEEGLLSTAKRLRVPPSSLKMLPYLEKNSRTSEFLRHLARGVGIDDERFGTVSYRQI